MFGEDEIIENNYPPISDELIKQLQKDFPNKLPDQYIDNYELGILIGQQKIIDKLISEKNYNENKNLED